MITREIIEDILLLVSKAPSAHNAQPWMIEYSLQGKVKIFLNDAAVPKSSDGTRRESIISIGCFIANLAVLLRDRNLKYKLEINEFSPRQSGYLAMFDISDKYHDFILPYGLLESLTKNLSDQIESRHNDRGPYRDEEIGTRLDAVMKRHNDFCAKSGLKLSAFIDKNIAISLGKLTFEAMKIILTLDSSKDELVKFVSNSENSKSTRKMQLSSLTTSGASTVEQWLSDPKTVERESDYWRKSIESGPGFLCISSYTDTRKDWLLTGILLEILLLELTALGYCHSIWAALIEIPTMVSPLMQTLNLDSRPLSLVRIGTPIAPMPKTSQRIALAEFATLID